MEWLQKILGTDMLNLINYWRRKIFKSQFIYLFAQLYNPIRYDNVLDAHIIKWFDNGMGHNMILDYHTEYPDYLIYKVIGLRFGTNT